VTPTFTGSLQAGGEEKSSSVQEGSKFPVRICTSCFPEVKPLFSKPSRLAYGTVSWWSQSGAVGLVSTFAGAADSICLTSVWTTLIEQNQFSNPRGVIARPCAPGHIPPALSEEKKPSGVKKKPPERRRGARWPPSWLRLVMRSTRRHLSRDTEEAQWRNKLWDCSERGERWEQWAKVKTSWFQFSPQELGEPEPDPYYTKIFASQWKDAAAPARGGCCPASPAPTPSPVFWKKDFYSARFLLNPPLPHLSPATSPSRAIGVQPEPTASQPQEERKDSIAPLPPSLHMHGEGKPRGKPLVFPVNQRCKLVGHSRQGRVWTAQRERASSLVHPGWLWAGGTAATGSLANTKRLPGQFGTLFKAACKCSSCLPASSLPPDNLLALLICYFLCKNLFFLRSPLSPEKAPGLGFPNRVSWGPLACSFFCILQGLVTTTFLEGGSKSNYIVFLSHI